MKQLFYATIFLLIISCNYGCHVNGNIGVQYMDTTVKAGDNFYAYANGQWLKTAAIPPTETSVGAFLDLYTTTKNNIKTLLEETASTTNSGGTIAQQVGDFFASGIDSAAIEQRGYEPIKPMLRQIDSIKNTQGVMEFVAAMHKNGIDILFGLGVGPDMKNSKMNLPSVEQGGLGLPDRDYYFKTDPATLAIVKAYQIYLTTLFTLIKIDPTTAAKNAMIIYDLEKQLATSHTTKVALRDPQKNYHKMAITDLEKIHPNINWGKLLTNLSVHTDSLNVAQPAYFTKVNAALKSMPISTWRLYLKANMLSSTASQLSTTFVNAQFDYVKAISGQAQIKPRWERIYQATNSSLGEALGQLYVKKYFPEKSKQRMEKLVQNLSAAFEQRINQLDWMSDSTKQLAKGKLHTFLIKIAYPDKWRDYSHVVIDRKKYFENVLACNCNDYEYMLSKVGKPVDRTEWGMTPPTINAYYNPLFNEIVFPAGILQGIFFNPNADDALNYGAIGSVIGHEMSHAFDDEGAQFDKDGNLKNWWTKSDKEKFTIKTQQLVTLFNGFTMLDSLHINGQLTLGENIGDLGGVAVAYTAFKMTEQGKGNKRIDGFTPDQRFFIAYAHVWREKRTDARVRQLLNIDPHAPGKYRVWNPLMNFTPFYTAFDVKKGDTMYRPEAERITIW